jgi:hypothetical protein
LIYIKLSLGAAWWLDTAGMRLAQYRRGRAGGIRSTLKKSSCAGLRRGASQREDQPCPARRKP